MPGLPTLIPRKPKDLVAAPLSAFESSTQAVLLKTTPYSEHAVLHAVTGMLVLAFILMGVIKVDRVVTAPGKVEVKAGEPPDS